MSDVVKDHKHAFKHKLINVEPDNDDYHGGAKGLVIAECACGKEYAVDYGDYKVLLDNQRDKRG